MGYPSITLVAAGAARFLISTQSGDRRTDRTAPYVGDDCLKLKFPLAFSLHLQNHLNLNRYSKRQLSHANGRAGVFSYGLTKNLNHQV